jgi:P4 family phage/plasmid primase-like protien
MNGRNPSYVQPKDRQSAESRGSQPPQGPSSYEDILKAEQEQTDQATSSEGVHQGESKTSGQGSSDPGGALNEHATEHQLASLLKAQLPALRCVGKDWYTYENGVWKRGDRDIFRPQSLAIQNGKSRTHRKATNILDHLESESQVNESTFLPFYRFAEDGAILVNCRSAVLRVTADGVLALEHSPDYLFTGQVSANFDPTAEAPIFEKVLREALPDPEDQSLFRIFIGYMLFPDCRFEAALVCYGDGGKGKSTLACGVRAALGADLVRSLSLLQICDPKSFHLDNLRNAAVNLSTELDALPIVGAENFKLLVSGEQVSADRKYQDLVSLTTSCKMWFLTNYLPRFQHGTDAELRRLRFLWFKEKPAVEDTTLKQRIALEGDGIFRLMIEGVRSLLVSQKIPHGGKGSEEARERFKVQNDPIAAFVQSCCVINPQAEVLKRELYNEYKEFLETNGLPEPQHESTFFRALYNRLPVQELRRRDGGGFLKKVAGVALRTED